MMNSQTNNADKKVEENNIFDDALALAETELIRQERCIETLSRMMKTRPISWGANLGAINRVSLLHSLRQDINKVVSFNIWFSAKPSREIPLSHFLMVMEGFPTTSFGSYIGRIFSEMLWNEFMNGGIMGSALYVDITYREIAMIIEDPSLFKIEKHFDLETYQPLEEEQLRQQALQDHRRKVEEHKRETKRMKKQLKKLEKENERIAKMTDEEIATKKVNEDLEADRLNKIQEKKDIAFASQFIEKEVKVQPTKTKKEKKRGNPYQKMLTLSREAGIKTINPDWVKWENENK